MWGKRAEKESNMCGQGDIRSLSGPDLAPPFLAKGRPYPDEASPASSPRPLCHSRHGTAGPRGSLPLEDWAPLPTTPEASAGRSQSRPAILPPGIRRAAAASEEVNRAKSASRRIGAAELSPVDGRNCSGIVSVIPRRPVGGRERSLVGADGFASPVGRPRCSQPIRRPFLQVSPCPSGQTGGRKWNFRREYRSARVDM